MSAITLCPSDPAKITCPPLTGPFWYVTFPVTEPDGLAQPTIQGNVARTRRPTHLTGPRQQEQPMTDPSTGEKTKAGAGENVARAQLG